MATPLSFTKPEIDETDRRLLDRLMRDGRATWSDLAESLDLTAPAIAQRVRRLEERGVIRHFAAWVAPEAVAPLCAFVAVRCDAGAPRGPVVERLVALEQTQECHRVADDYDFLLKVRCGSLAELEELVGRTLIETPGVASARPIVVLSTLKETPVLPLTA